MALGRWGRHRMCNEGTSPACPQVLPGQWHPSVLRLPASAAGPCVVRRRRGRCWFLLRLRATCSVKALWPGRTPFPAPRSCCLFICFFFPFFLFPPFDMCYGHLPLSQPMAAACPPARETPCPSLPAPLSMASRCRSPAPAASSENYSSPGAGGARPGPCISASSS